TAMPAFKNQLTQEQIQQLVAYVMTFSKGAVALNKSASHETASAGPPRRPGPEDQATTGRPMPAMREVTGERLAHATKEPQNWMTYFGSYDAQRYSPLNQITRANVNKLAPVWAFSDG
ncbi:MAG: hypothetical protein J2P21_01975, partial [Chloracidobacterium sp.]|nr:hypothetical protein [Chloracidobacterium sp.]